MPEALWISFAFVLGLTVKAIGLPPLVGYLAAGFVLSGLSAATDLAIEATDVLEHIAHLGVLLLLFTVGLKLKLRSIISPEVIGGSLLHFGYAPLLLIGINGAAIHAEELGLCPHCKKKESKKRGK